MLVGTIINIVGEVFINRLNEFMPFLLKGLESYKEVDLLKSSINTLCNLILTLSGKLSQELIDRIISIIFLFSLQFRHQIQHHIHCHFLLYYLN